MLVTLGLAGCKSPAKTSGSSAIPSNAILVGEYGSLTGQQATFGTSTDNGIELATNQLNAAGGINGRPVHVFVEDDQGLPTNAGTAVTKLIDEDHVISILGEVASSCSLAGGKVCQQNGIPMISPSSTNTKVTEIGNDIFRVCFIDPFQAAVDARFIHDKLGMTRVAVFTNTDNDYSLGFTKNFIQAFTAMGGTIVIQKGYGASDTNYQGALTAIQQAKPQCILIPGYYNEVAAIAKQARGMGITCPLVGGDGWDSPDLIKNGGSAINGCYFSDHLAMDDPNPVVQNFVKTYKAAYNHEPDSLAALGYDSANLLYAAMKRAKSLSPDDIRQAISTTKDFPGVTGNITINAQRNADKPAVIIKIVNGQFKLDCKIANPNVPLAK